MAQFIISMNECRMSVTTRGRVAMMPIGTPRLPYTNSVEGTWQWVDYFSHMMQSLKSPVRTHCAGYAYNLAGFLLAAEEGPDPFGRILKCCKLTESQEAKLLNCPFARDSENVTLTDSVPLSQFSSMTHSEDDHIFVLTPPETQISADESTLEVNSVFHTPPEHHLSSSEDQNPNVDDTRRQVLDDEPESKRIRAVSGDTKTEIEEDDGVHINEVIDLSDSEIESGRLKGKAVEECAEMHLSDSEIGGEDCDSSGRLKGKAVEERAEMPTDGGEGIEEDNDVAEVVGLFGMVDKLTAIFGFPDAGEHVDFLDTAKENGMVFPKPRWHQES
ncbi:uncharacterized protein LOC125222932 isoform X2 [Salvia hispanica]|uniref:uncharacterized protein LOC125222932 isoform X2 n=1 Tax=Salvia hispanica TaxID=49212 RepID=UPI002009679D|nr:uncharacterized protein LOC125222932 isoform X2 [Salvia hispanica]